MLLGLLGMAIRGAKMIDKSTKVWTCDYGSGNCKDCDDIAHRFFISGDNTQPIKGPTGVTTLDSKPCSSAKQYVIMPIEEYEMLSKIASMGFHAPERSHVISGKSCSICKNRYGNPNAIEDACAGCGADTKDGFEAEE